MERRGESVRGNGSRLRGTGAALAAATVALAIAVPATAASALAAPALAGRYTMLDLGKIERNAEATSVNLWGEVAGNAYEPGVGWHAFLWSPVRTGGGYQRLPGLGCDGCATEVRARAINDLGVIAGEAGAPDGVHAVLWVDGAIRDLGVFGDSTNVAAMNNRGEVAGAAIAADGRWHGYVWSPVTGLRDLSPDQGRAVPYDINDLGQVAGECGSGAVATSGCVWQPDGTVRTIEAPGGYSASARGINNLGVVVGTMGDAYRHSVAFRWAAGELTRLTSAEDYSAVALDLNDAGTVIGYRYLPAAAGPWVWRHGQVTDLPASASGPKQGPAIPRDINALGVIAGRSGTADDPWFHPVLWRWALTATP